MRRWIFFTLIVMIGARTISSFMAKRSRVLEFAVVREFSDYRRRTPNGDSFRRGSADRTFNGDSNYGNRGSRMQYENKNRGSRIQYGNREDKPEPAYGRYDGDHLYGINSVRLALMAGRRNISELLVQEGMNVSNKKDAKAASEILDLASELGVPMREFQKHDLNMITDNKPHQGFVLRAKPLEFIKMTHLEPTEKFSCVLALDEVWDPQNFGALLRTAFFLRCHKVVVCAKNSAPLSPAVSRASAGALELMSVYSTDNLMKFLDKSVDNGWQVVGTDLSPKSVSLYDVPLSAPTVLVLGNEGHGIRTNILRRCTHLVRIGEARTATTSATAAGGVIEDTGFADTTTVGSDVTSNSDRNGNRLSYSSESGSVESNESGIDEGTVDSLNVSVTGAIILHHMLSTTRK